MPRYIYEDWVTEEGLIKIEGWARNGLSDEQIAHNIGIRRETLYAWKKQHPNIANALKKGKEVVDLMVENALFKRAMGYEYEETTLERTWNEASECWDMVPTKVVHKKQAADPTSMIFWLKNRKPEEWRDKQNIEHSGEVAQRNVQEVKIEIEQKFDDAETAELARQLYRRTKA